MFHNRKLKSGYQNIARFIKNFLHIDNGKEFLVFMVFLLIAFFLWYLLTMNKEFQSVYKVHLDLKDVPSQYILTEPLPEEIELTLKDKGKKLVEYKAADRLKYVKINFNNYTPVNGWVAITGTELQNLFRTFLASSTEITSISVDTLHFCVAEKKSRLVPVRIKGTVTANEQYTINQLVLTPDSVNVWASKNILDTLKVLYTQPVAYTNLTDSFKALVALHRPVRGLRCEPNAVQLSVQVSPYVEKSLELAIGQKGFPQDWALITFPSTVKAIVTIDMQQYKQLSATDFVLTIPFSEVEGNPYGKVQLSLSQLPKGVRSVRLEPSEVEYLIEKRN